VECFLWNLDTADALHAAFAFPAAPEIVRWRLISLRSILLELLANRRGRFSQDNFAADRCLQRDCEHLTRNQISDLGRFVRRIGSGIGQQIDPSRLSPGLARISHKRD
jgi:hypothetical protein